MPLPKKVYFKYLPNVCQFHALNTTGKHNPGIVDDSGERIRLRIIRDLLHRSFNLFGQGKIKNYGHDLVIS